jgi:hypothetical protein
LRSSLAEYLGAVARTWWARVTLLVSAAGLASELTNIVIPSVVWWVLVGVAIVLAQFTAFHRVRAERERLRAKIAADEAPPAPTTFVPDLFEGRLFPTSNYPVIESGQTGLVIRGALAFSLDGEHDQIGSSVQKLFEDHVASSAIEGWLQRQMDTRHAVPSEQWWTRVQPTRSQIVTLARPAAKFPLYGYSLSAHCTVNSNPGLHPWHAGYGELIASIIIRPVEQTEDGIQGNPLSFEDLFVALVVLQAALVDQIAPTMVQSVTGSELKPRSFASIAIANSGSVSDYVGLSHYHWPRADGSYDQNALYGRVASNAVLTDPAERTREVKGWLARFLTDGGYSDFEADIERLQTPTLPQPLPT